MFERIQLQIWVLSIDKEATIAAHEKLPSVWPSGCTCQHCENFATAGHLMPGEFLHFCSTVGTDPVKPIEVYEMGSGNDEGTRFYGGWYHLVGRIVGRIVSGANSYGSESLAMPLHELMGGFQVSFTDERADLMQQGFPTPVLQLDFFGDVPWVLLDDPDT